MSLYLRFLSDPLDESTKMHALKVHVKAFFDRELWLNGVDLQPTFVGKGHQAKPTDVLVHICAKFDEIALNINTAGQDDDVGGKTDLHSTETSAGSNRFVYEGYSEVWLSEAARHYGISLGSANTPEPYRGEEWIRDILVNAGTLIGATALHEAMHMKVLAAMWDAGNANWSLHSDGGGGIAAPKAGIRKHNGKLVASVNSENLRLIRTHFNFPVRQLNRTG